MINFNGEGDDVTELSCDCCGAVLRVSYRNLERLSHAAQLRFPPNYQIGSELVFDMGAVPDDVDLSGEVSAAEIRRVVYAAFRMEPIDA